ncbi:MAG: exo-alpha-sialidase [Alphaproteobacteria bacterium]|nr:exo-alpha-sialidase [Alphaproteobacteria bacterium]
MIKLVYAILILLSLAAPAVAGERIAQEKLSHIHGLAPAPAHPKSLFVATHHGLYRADPDGTAEKISQTSDDLMGFSAVPGSPGKFLASGHPPMGGNLGVIASSDGGVSWSQVSPGNNGPVDFHAMDISKADPKVIYGHFGKIQVSRNGGMSWKTAAQAPEGLIALGAGAKDANTLYAATKSGLMISRDGAQSWTRAHPSSLPVSSILVMADGTVYAFLYGEGLIKGSEGSDVWTLQGKADGDWALFNLTGEGTRLYAKKSNAGLVQSDDGGKSWKAFGK